MRGLAVTLALFIFSLIAISGSEGSIHQVKNHFPVNQTVKSDRDEKFLSLFSIVRFSNDACTGTNSYNGTCLTNSECSAASGTASGSCASGFGVCCIITLAKCGATATRNNTYWQNPLYPNTYTTSGQCSLFVTKMNSNICQLRLDFVEFTLADPDSATLTTYGQCLTDAFTVSGASNTVPVICGVNTNQHMYLHMTPGTDTFTLNIITSGTTTNRLWNILVRQIPCGTTYTAPSQCLQWYSEASGTITSFNYRYAATPAVQHLAYQDYNICLRQNQGFCGIGYTACSTPPAAAVFLISGDAASPAAVVATSLTDSKCWTDWLQIPCASDQMNSVLLSTSTSTAVVPCVSKLCGAFFNAVTAKSSSATVYSYQTPFTLHFYTDSGEGIAGEGIGFCLTYTQQPCLTTTTTSG